MNSASPLCQMGAVQTGQNFVYQGRIYVRLPELNFRCGSHGFVTNCAYVVDHGEFDPPESIMAYICDRTIVEAIKTVLT